MRYGRVTERCRSRLPGLAGVVCFRPHGCTARRCRPPICPLLTGAEESPGVQAFVQATRANCASTDNVRFHSLASSAGTGQPARSVRGPDSARSAEPRLAPGKNSRARQHWCRASVACKLVSASAVAQPAHLILLWSDLPLSRKL